jgi:hypothetical protein
LCADLAAGAEAATEGESTGHVQHFDGFVIDTMPALPADTDMHEADTHVFEQVLMKIALSESRKSSLYIYNMYLIFSLRGFLEYCHV